MNTQLKTSDLDKTRFGVLSTVVSALGTQLRVLATGARQTLSPRASSPAPILPSSATPADAPTLADPAMIKPSNRQRAVIDAHRGDWP
jgi:hypothetical protein